MSNHLGLDGFPRPKQEDDSQIAIKAINIEEVFNKYDGDAKTRVVSNLKQAVRKGVNHRRSRLSRYEKASSLKSIEKRDSTGSIVKHLMQDNMSIPPLQNNGNLTNSAQNHNTPSK